MSENLRNLKKTKRKSIVSSEYKNLTELNRIPNNKTIMNRFVTLCDTERNRRKRIIIVAKEVICLWNKLSFPVLSFPSVTGKVTKIISIYEKEKKHRKSVKNFEEMQGELFDITKKGGSWLCSEDKNFYAKQLETCGRVGYSTEKVAPLSTIHPSKRSMACSSKTTFSTPNPILSRIYVDDDISSDSNDQDYVSYESQNSSKRHKTKAASKLVIKHDISSRKASSVCQSLASDGISLPTPSQSGVWRRVIKEADIMKSKIISLLQTEREFVLHFDGKKIKNNEYQAVVLQHASHPVINLGILHCKSGSANDIFIKLKELLNQYDGWNAIAMIITDTTAVNTGVRNGIVVKLQREFQSFGLNPPQFVGCQHHILDLLVRHILDHFIPTTTMKPTLDYKFIDEIVSDYNGLQERYKVYFLKFPKFYFLGRD